MTCNDIIDSLEVVGKPGQWWIKSIVHHEEQLGSYETQAEAKDDMAGIKRYYRHIRDTPELADCRPDISNTYSPPLPRDIEEAPTCDFENREHESDQQIEMFG